MNYTLPMKTAIGYAKFFNFYFIQLIYNENISEFFTLFFK